MKLNHCLLLGFITLSQLAHTQELFKASDDDNDRSIWDLPDLPPNNHTIYDNIEINILPKPDNNHTSHFLKDENEKLEEFLTNHHDRSDDEKKRLEENSGII